MDKNDTSNSRKAAVESLKLILRLSLLVGVPAILGELAKSKPEWGGAIGVILLVIDKYIHENPSIKSNGISPV